MRQSTQWFLGFTVLVGLSGCQFAGACLDDAAACQSQAVDNNGLGGDTSLDQFDSQGSCSQSVAMGLWSEGSDRFKMEGSCNVAGSLNGCQVQGDFRAGSTASSSGETIALNLSSVTNCQQNSISSPTQNISSSPYSSTGTNQTTSLQPGNFNCQVARISLSSVIPQIQMRCVDTANSMNRFTKTFQGEDISTQTGRFGSTSQGLNDMSATGESGFGASNANDASSSPSFE